MQDFGGGNLVEQGIGGSGVGDLAAGRCQGINGRPSKTLNHDTSKLVIPFTRRSLEQTPDLGPQKFFRHTESLSRAGS
jgi:hypothetical protein